MPLELSRPRLREVAARTLRDGLRVPAGPAFTPSRMRSVLDRERSVGFFAEAAARWPRLAFFRVGKQRFYLVNDPDLVRQVLVTDGRKLDKGPGLRAARPLLGDGLVTSHRDVQLPRRRLVSPAFTRDRMTGYAVPMVAAAEALSQRWESVGAEVDLSEEMARYTLDVLGRTVLGADLVPEAETIAEALTLALRGWERMMLPGGQQLVRLPLPRFRAMWAASETLHGVVARMLAAPVAVDGAAPSSALDILRAARDGDARLDHDALMEETMTLLLAGHETTANALTWALYSLAEHPAEQALLRESLDGVGPVGYADLPGLHRTYAVVAETMRLYPPAWILERVAETDLEVDGYRVPAGSILLASQYALHRDPRFWDRPDDFVPSRWLDADGAFSESAPGVPKGAWFPFGAGSRMCLGESFAWTEAVLALAILVPRWSPTPDPARVVRTRAAVTLRPSGGLPVTLHRVPVGV